jgi:Cys-tRNA(Pro)/Cys-tRNA(Cys) deacylase
MFFSPVGVTDRDIIPLVYPRLENTQVHSQIDCQTDIIIDMLPSHVYLNRLNIPYTTVTFPPSTPKGAANVALAIGLSEHQAVKTLIFSSDLDEHILVMVGGDKNVISGHLKKIVGSRNVQLAKPDLVLQITGYQVGSIPPFCWQPEGFRSFLDTALLDESILAVGAGIWGNEILITPENLLKACSGIAVNLSNREMPV